MKRESQFANIAYGKVVSVEFDKTFVHKYFECTMYQFKIEIITPKGDTMKGTFYERYIKTVDRLFFKVGHEGMLEINKYKDQLKPINYES